jgi:hypothetical protein
MLARSPIREVFLRPLCIHSKIITSIANICHSALGRFIDASFG